MAFGKGVKNIQAAAYNGAHTVSENLDTGERTQTSNLLWVSLNSSEL